MRYAMAVAVFIAVMAFDLAPAQAYGRAPWCAVVDVGFGDVMWDCHYRSVEECRPNVIAGNRGTCNPNPAWSGWQRHNASHPKRHRKHRVNRD
jgi:hypothetical protein